MGPYKNLEQVEHGKKRILINRDVKKNRTRRYVRIKLVTGRK